MVELATYHFQTVPEVVEADQEQAEKMFGTGEVLVYNILDDFSDLHSDYYSQFTSKRHNIDIGELKDSYEEAYDTVENMEDIRELGEGLDSGDIGGSLGDGDLGGDL